MLRPVVLNVVTRGIKVKLDRGEDLEEILATYVNFDEKEKDQIRERLK